MTRRVEMPRVHIIGMGEVGRRINESLCRAGVDTETVTRTTGWSNALADTESLRLVCVREEALGEVLGHLNGTPLDRIVVVQNGWIRPLLSRTADLTRGLVWFTAKGDFFTVLRSSPFCGPQAEMLAHALTDGGLPSHAVDRGSFDRLDVEKMAFNCVVGLPLAVHGLSLREYLESHGEEARALFSETATVCARAIDSDVESHWWKQFLLSAEPLGWVRVATAKALGFRNGAVVELARQIGVDAPVNTRLLAENDRMCATKQSLD